MRNLIVCALFAVSTHLMAQPPADCQAGMAAFQQEEYKASIQPLTKCLALPLPPQTQAFVLRMRAQAFGEQSRYQEALADQQQSLALAKPEDVWPLIMLAVYHRGLKQYEEALAALKEAESYDEDGPGTGPGMAVAYHTGWTLQDMGLHQRAVETFTAAILKQPDYGWVFYRRALSYEALGDHLHARDDMAKAYKFIRPEGYNQEVIATLKQYGYTPKQKAQ